MMTSAVLASSSDRAGAVCHTYIACVSRLVLPIQLSFIGSKRAPAGCSSGVVGMPLKDAPITVPSNGPAW